MGKRKGTNDHLYLTAKHFADNYDPIPVVLAAQHHIIDVQERYEHGLKLLEVWHSVVKQYAVDTLSLRLIGDAELEDAVNATYYWTNAVIGDAEWMIKVMKLEQARRLEQ